MLAGPGESPDVSAEAFTLTQLTQVRKCRRNLCTAVTGYTTESVPSMGCSITVGVKRASETGGKVISREQDQLSLEYPPPEKKIAPVTRSVQASSWDTTAAPHGHLMLTPACALGELGCTVWASMKSISFRGFQRVLGSAHTPCGHSLCPVPVVSAVPVISESCFSRGGRHIP